MRWVISANFRLLGNIPLRNRVAKISMHECREPIYIYFIIFAGILFIGQNLEVINFDISISIYLTEEFLKLNLVVFPLTSFILTILG